LGSDVTALETDQCFAMIGSDVTVLQRFKCLFESRGSDAEAVELSQKTLEDDGVSFFVVKLCHFSRIFVMRIKGSYPFDEFYSQGWIW